MEAISEVLRDSRKVVVKLEAMCFPKTTEPSTRKSCTTL